MPMEGDLSMIAEEGADSDGVPIAYGG